MFKHKETKVKVRRQEINYNYSDANIIPDVNDYLMNGELDMKLIKLTLNVFDNRIRIVFRSDFEVRREIANKLRELDVDLEGMSIKKKLFFKRLITMKRNKAIEEAVEDTIIIAEDTDSVVSEPIDVMLLGDSIGDAMILRPECPKICSFERVTPFRLRTVPIQRPSLKNIPKVTRYDVISAMNKVPEARIKFEKLEEVIEVDGCYKIKRGGGKREWIPQNIDSI